MNTANIAVLTINQDLENILTDLLNENPENIVSELQILDFSSLSGLDFLYSLFSYLLNNNIPPGTEIKRKTLLKLYRQIRGDLKEDSSGIYFCEGMKILEQVVIKPTNKGRKRVVLPEKEELNSIYNPIIAKRQEKRGKREEKIASKKERMHIKKDPNLDDVVQGMMTKTLQELMEEGGIELKNNITTATNMIYIFFNYLLSQRIQPGTYVDRNSILKYFSAFCEDEYLEKKISRGLFYLSRHGINFQKHRANNKTWYILPDKEELDKAKPVVAEKRENIRGKRRYNSERKYQAEWPTDFLDKCYDINEEIEAIKENLEDNINLANPHNNYDTIKNKIIEKYKTIGNYKPHVLRWLLPNILVNLDYEFLVRHLHKIQIHRGPKTILQGSNEIYYDSSLR